MSGIVFIRQPFLSPVLSKGNNKPASTATGIIQSNLRANVATFLTPEPLPPLNAMELSRLRVDYLIPASSQVRLISALTLSSAVLPASSAISSSNQAGFRNTN